MADRATLDSRRRPEEDRDQKLSFMVPLQCLVESASDSPDLQSHALGRPDRTKAFVFQFVPSFAPCEGLYL